MVSKAAMDGSGKYRHTAIRTPDPAGCSVPNRPSYRGPPKFLVDSLIEAVVVSQRAGGRILLKTERSLVDGSVRTPKK
jgi:hypothetical protein